MATPRMWVVVADGARARVFVRQDQRLVPALDHDLTGSRLRDRDIDADKPGRSFDSMGAHRHGLSPRTDARRHAEDEFARELAETLHSAFKAGSFERLVIIAAPRALGEIRQHLNSHVAGVVAAEINRDLINLTPEAIWDHVEKALQP